MVNQFPQHSLGVATQLLLETVIAVFYLVLGYA